MPAPQTRPPRKHRWYAHPVISFLLFAVLLLHASLQPNWGPRGGVTLVGSITGAMLGRSVGCALPAFDNWYLVPSGVGWTIMDEEQFSTQIGTPAIMPPGILTAARLPQTTRGGIWSVSWEVRRTYITCVPLSGGPMPAAATLASAHSALIAELTRRGESSSVIAQWQAGDQTHWRPLWSGIAQDVTVLIVIIFLLRSLTWLPELVAAQSRPAHLCRHCTYDLRRLPPGPCPECGRPQLQPTQPSA